jgi:hypothetical protein
MLILLVTLEPVASGQDASRPAVRNKPVNPAHVQQLRKDLVETCIEIPYAVSFYRGGSQ